MCPLPSWISASQLHIRMPILYTAFVLTFPNSSAVKCLLSMRPFIYERPLQTFQQLARHEQTDTEPMREDRDCRTPLWRTRSGFVWLINAQRGEDEGCCDSRRFVLTNASSVSFSLWYSFRSKTHPREFSYLAPSRSRCAAIPAFFWGGEAFPISRQGAKADKLSRRGEDRNFKTSYRITSHFGPDEESPRDHFPKQGEPPFINQVAQTRCPCTSVGKTAKSQLASSLIRIGLILLHVARTVLIKRELLEEKAANFTLLSWSHKADTE